ncbi:Metal-dependent protein hydrolase [Sesbania bispinosa]|nr:Metal-dependent protein hydrolase [Sesbania bispinosa]
MVKLPGLWQKRLLVLGHGIQAPSFSTHVAKRVGTHSGTFHCDEALACFMLRLSKHFSGADIVRTRDWKLLKSMDAVVDVGGVYDPLQHRYDHHQRNFNQVFGYGFTTKLSSAGLVYKHFGLEIIAKVLELDEAHPHVHHLYPAIYRNFVEAIDAVDNGVNQYDLNAPPKYAINTSLPSRIKRLNLGWLDSDWSSYAENEAFHQAMALAGGEFLENVNYYAKSWLPARSIVMECLAARETVDSSGEIMKLNQSCPDDRSENWRLQAVAVSPVRFESRKPLPYLWRGLENDKLSKVTGIPGCTFVHMSGFIGGNRSYDGALAMARASLKAQAMEG